MPDFRSYPPLEVFERLQARDGLSINAERWHQAHSYHRRRQNFHYQALYQPGIVYGLGVAPISDQPDGRLLQIQPGVAIDIEGNPIVLKQPEEFRLASEPGEGQTLLVYLAVSYVDPDTLRQSPHTELVQETFRIVEKLHLAPQDVEICRILLQAGATQIHVPPNPFFPGFNQLDLRGRTYPQPYPALQLKVGQILRDGTPDPEATRGVTGLLRSLPALSPFLQADPAVQTVGVRDLYRDISLDCQLLSISYGLWQNLPGPAWDSLKRYMAAGGVLLLVVDFHEARLNDLLMLERELEAGLVDAEKDPEIFEQIGEPLKQEIEANQQAIIHSLAELEQQVAIGATRLGLPLTASGDLEPDHPLRCQPFRFSQFPKCPDYPIVLKNWGGLVFMVGDLSRCWGADPAQNLSREEVRSAQEWGVNLLHFAAQWWEWTRSMQSPPASPNGSVDTLQRRTQRL
ncbi:MAG: hypothetical protein SFW36_07585 [Leptolyngbyaceae cyanobacterium bins.59]|nr:hypothetical protein [Leptolyngbyaceae cyanobacterium bins.59]